MIASDTRQRRDTRPPARPDPAPPTPAQRTERALRVVYQLVLPTIQRSDSGRLGYATPSYARALTLTDAFLQDLALDGREQWDVLKMQAEGRAENTTGNRVMREQREADAVLLLEETRRLPEPVREPVVMRACGLRWREIMRALPERASFSVTDDYELGLRMVWGRAQDAVVRLG